MAYTHIHTEPRYVVIYTTYVFVSTFFVYMTKSMSYFSEYILITKQRMHEYITEKQTL